MARFRFLGMVLPSGLEGYVEAVKEWRSRGGDVAEWRPIADAWDEHDVRPPLEG